MPSYELDSNVFDDIVEDTEFEAKLWKLVSSGKITLFKTHIQEDEIMAITSLEKLEKKAKILAFLEICKFTVTTGAFFDISRFDCCTYDSSEALDKISKKKGQQKDALIAATADTEADFFVTGEKKRLKNDAQKYLKKAKVLTVKEFKNDISQLDC